ncbi:unnamed protein product [Bathycoccus prasinos]
MSSVTTASESGNQRKKTTNENLGWLASGSFLPRKRKPIENITQSSLVFLEAEKAKLKSENAFSKPSTTTVTAGGTTAETTTRGRRPTKRISKEKRELLKENKGVRERNLKDVRDKEREKTTLETKASLYEKLSKDDDLLGTTMKVPKDGFECMDFRRKRLEEKEREEYEYDFGSTYERRRYAGREDEDEDEDEDEEERERNEFREQRRREDEEREAREFRDEEKRDKERRLVEDVARETEAARREREEAKMETVEAREKLKRKFIEEKIAQLKEKKRLEKEEKRKKVKTTREAK